MRQCAYIVLEEFVRNMGRCHIHPDLEYWNRSSQQVTVDIIDVAPVCFEIELPDFLFFRFCHQLRPFRELDIRCLPDDGKAKE